MDTYEKEYKDALRRANEYHCDGIKQCIIDTLEYIFPELKESEDERIRKSIYIYLDWLDGRKDYAPRGEYTIRDMISWLEKQGETFTKKDVDDAYLQGISDAKNEFEKQGEQNLADKVEPKFHEGDWIISNNKKSTYQVIEVKRGIYIIRDNADNHEYHIGIEECEKTGRLFTIQDAKDGDVFVNGSNIFIFHFINDTRLMGYCHVNTDDGRFYNDLGKNECFCLIDAVVVPATKEQRDTLFAKMHEAGYMWDSESKQLLSLKAKPNDTQKSSWSEEDEEIALGIEQVMICASFLNIVPDKIDRIRTWLKSLKERLS